MKELFSLNPILFVAILLAGSVYANNSCAFEFLQKQQNIIMEIVNFNL